eukprot:scaffold132092_cov48-Phaeocystis_antarctica.AAC.1
MPPSLVAGRFSGGRARLLAHLADGCVGRGRLHRHGGGAAEEARGVEERRGAGPAAAGDELL